MDSVLQRFPVPSVAESSPASSRRHARSGPAVWPKLALRPRIASHPPSPLLADKRTREATIDRDRATSPATCRRADLWGRSTARAERSSPPSLDRCAAKTFLQSEFHRASTSYHLP